MKSTLLKNLGFLTLSQIANYLLPLVTIPYVTRIVGPENFGLIEFAQATVLYFTVIVNYGFNRTASRSIAIVSSDMKEVSAIFSSVMIAKAMLFFVSVIAYLILIFAAPDFTKHVYLLLVAFPIVLGWAIYPMFVFEGLQKLSVIAITDVSIKAASAILILSLIKNQDQYFLVPLINGLMQVVFAAASFYYALKKIPGLRFHMLDRKAVFAQLKEGSFVFYSNFFNTVYNFGTVLIGAFFLSPIQLGIYAAAYKLIVVANSFLFKPLLGAFYPYLSAKLVKGFFYYSNAFKKGLYYLLIASFLTFLITFLIPEFLLDLVFGHQYSDGAIALRIMSPTLVLGAFIHMFLAQGMLHLKKDKSFMLLTISAGLLSIPLSLFLMAEYSINGAAWVRVIVDTYLAVASGVLYYKSIKKYAIVH